jgi:hypothetical protein
MMRGPQPRCHQALRDLGGGAPLGVRDLRMGVQVPPEFDQFLRVAVEELVEVHREVRPGHAPPPAGRRAGPR